ncbi:MAG: NADH-quinone oxidoreductase subunit NuoK [Cyclobacteriaceae bacterium]
MSEIGLHMYLCLAALLFSSGLFVVLSKRNAVFVLIGIELMLNGANLVLASFSQIDLNGQIFAIFSVVLTVCEVAIALAILLNVYKKYATSDLDDLQEIGNG